jgi:hypothetical protein
VSLGFGRDIARSTHEIDRGSQARFTEVRELKVGGEGGIVRGRGERRRTLAGHQVLHGLDGLDHRDVAVH